MYKLIFFFLVVVVVCVVLLSLPIHLNYGRPRINGTNKGTNWVVGWWTVVCCRVRSTQKKKWIS